MELGNITVKLEAGDLNEIMKLVSHLSQAKVDIEELKTEMKRVIVELKHRATVVWADNIEKKVDGISSQAGHSARTLSKIGMDAK